jgi:uncharacterized protein
LDLPPNGSKLSAVNPDQPLSQRELDELDAFLASEAAGDESMDVSTLHGYLTAVAIGPGLVLPSEWLPAVWGDDQGPEFPSEREAQRIHGLILRLYNSILRILREAPEKFLPILVEEETDDGKPELLPEPWCEGFLEGMYLRKKDWEPLLSNQEGALALSPILAFVHPETLKEIQASAREPKPTREQIMGMIPLAVAALYSYWLEHRQPLRRDLARDAAPPAARPKVGRNDPCPCGSGKKYKKCCALRPT